jgi:hypothetical protein
MPGVAGPAPPPAFIGGGGFGADEIGTPEEASAFELQAASSAKNGHSTAVTERATWQRGSASRWSVDIELPSIEDR